MSEEEFNSGEGSGEGQGSSSDAFSAISKQLEAMNQQFAQQQATTQAQIDQMANSIIQSKQSEQSYSSDDDDFYSTTPSKLKADMLKEAEKIAEQKLQQNQRINAAASSVVAQYPEFGDPANKAYSEYLEVHRGLPQHLQNTPEGIELAASRAASKMGLKPRSQRGEVNEYSMGASGSKSSGGSKRSKDPELDEKTVEFSRLLGRDVNDPKVLEGLKKASSRKYGKYK